MLAGTRKARRRSRRTRLGPSRAIKKEDKADPSVIKLESDDDEEEELDSET